MSLTSAFFFVPSFLAKIFSRYSDLEKSQRCANYILCAACYVLNVVCIEMNALVESDARGCGLTNQFFKSVGNLRTGMEQVETVGYLGTSKIRSVLRLFPARSRRCERSCDVKRDTAKMGTLIVETSESE